MKLYTYASGAAFFAIALFLLPVQSQSAEQDSEIHIGGGLSLILVDDEGTIDSDLGYAPYISAGIKFPLSENLYAGVIADVKYAFVSASALDVNGDPLDLDLDGLVLDLALRGGITVRDALDIGGRIGVNYIDVSISSDDVAGSVSDSDTNLLLGIDLSVPIQRQEDGVPSLYIRGAVTYVDGDVYIDMGPVWRF